MVATEYTMNLNTEIISDYVLSNWGISDHSTIYYGSPDSAPPSSRIIIVPDPIILQPDRTIIFRMPTVPLQEMEAIPLLFGTPQVEKTSSCLIVYADILASSFFMLTRQEELLCNNRDRHGRFLAQFSIAGKEGIVTQPFVDKYRNLLFKWFKQLGIQPPHQNNTFKVAITHDVDVLLKYPNPLKNLLECFTNERTKNDIPECLHTLITQKNDPYDTFDLLRKLDLNFREKASFPVDIIYFFMAGGNSQYDGQYSINDQRTKNLITSVQNDGAIIGLHPSYEAGGDPNKIIEEKERLESVCGSSIRHSRHHFLRFRKPEHLHYLEEAGITDDYTMGYPDHIGFRCGDLPTLSSFRLYKTQNKPNHHAPPLRDGMFTGQEGIYAPKL